MTLETLQKEMMTALKEKDKLKKETIAAIINTAKMQAIANCDKDNVSEELVDAAIRKEYKTVNEQLETCPADRTDKKEEYTTRKEIIESLMPKQLTEDEIKSILEEKFSEVLATKNKGEVMKTVMPFFKGKADGKLVNKIIMSYLN